jgi:hypothetical protein
MKYWGWCAAFVRSVCTGAAYAMANYALPILSAMGLVHIERIDICAAAKRWCKLRDRAEAHCNAGSVKRKLK